MVSTSVLGDGDVFPRLAETINVGAAGCRGDVVVGGSVKDPDGSVCHVEAINEYSVARRIQSDVTGEDQVGSRAVHRRESL